MTSQGVMILLLLLLFKFFPSVLRRMDLIERAIWIWAVCIGRMQIR